MDASFSFISRQPVVCIGIFSEEIFEDLDFAIKVYTYVATSKITNYTKFPMDLRSVLFETKVTFQPIKLI